MLRDATIDDTEMLFLWRNSDEIRSMLFSQDVIAFETHKHWLRCGLDSSTKYLFIYEEAEPCGFAQLDRVSADRKTFEWGFYKAPSAPQGVGEWMLREILHHVFQSIGAQEVIGKVLTFNTVSMNLHRKLGFELRKMDREKVSQPERTYDVAVFVLTQELYKKSNGGQK